MVSLHALALSHADLLSGNADLHSVFASQLSRATGKSCVRFSADGRNALFDILSCLDLKRTDEVLLPAYTCKVLENVVRQFCKPVFVDVEDAAVMRIDDAGDKITRRTKALILVHPYGVSADASSFARLCKNEGLVLIEDLAQSFCGTLAGKPLGSFGDYAFCSFRFSKDISCLTGGAALSNDPLPDRVFSKPPSDFSVRAKMSALLALQRHAAAFAQKAFMRLTSAEKRQAFVRNASNLSDFQTGLLALQAARMPAVIAARRKNAAYLRKHLPKRVLPPLREGTYYRFPIRTFFANDLQRFLLQRGVACERMYDYALSPLSGALAAAKQTLCIPVHHRLKNDELQSVVDFVDDFFEQRGGVQ